MNGTLYRPSQDCSLRYGWGLNVCAINEMDERNYSETVVSKALPNWDNNVLGVHTFNVAEGLSVSDGLLRQRHW
jgi:hypothetical protein